MSPADKESPSHLLANSRVDGTVGFGVGWGVWRTTDGKSRSFDFLPIGEGTPAVEAKVVALHRTVAAVGFARRRHVTRHSDGGVASVLGANSLAIRPQSGINYGPIKIKWDGVGLGGMGVAVQVSSPVFLHKKTSENSQIQYPVLINSGYFGYFWPYTNY